MLIPTCKICVFTVMTRRALKFRLGLSICFGNMRTHRALLTGVLRWDFQDFTASPLLFIFQHGHKKDTLAAWENEKIQVSEKGIERCIKICSAENLIFSREWLLIGKGLDPSFSFDLRRYFRLPAGDENKS